MRLNKLSPATGAKKKAVRVGRGIASGKGKTAGRGHKGQTSRTGGKIRIGFEGGQTPLHRRIPKSGFVSRQASFNAEVRLHELEHVQDAVITIEALKKANIINDSVKRVKVIQSGKITKAVTLSGVGVTAGAKSAIEAAGGKVEA
jgi:large subunit ribosomal protein L15